MKVLIVSCLLACSLSACGGDFVPGSRIDKLRILAVQADAPFAKPGERVAIEPLLAAPDSEPVSWAFATCSQPVASSVESCLRALDASFHDFNPALTNLQVDVNVESEHAGGALLGVVLVACPGTIEAGMTRSVPVVCRGAAGKPLPLDAFEVGMKRIFVRSAERNANPTITALTWDGAPWAEDDLQLATACEARGDDITDCPAVLRHRIGIQTSAAEHGVDVAAFEEQQIVQVYATHGSFEYEVRIAGAADNRWVARHSAHSSDEELATLWFVVRDDRGGVSWQRRQVRVQ